MEVRQIAVVGLSRFGSALAETLYGNDYEVLGIDINEEKVNDMAERLTHAIVMDAVDARALTAVGIANFDVVFVTIKTLQPSILCTLTLKEQGCPYLIAIASSASHAKILERIGADRVVFPEQDMAVRLAHSFSTAGLVEYMDMSDDFSIAEIKPPQNFIGQTVRELDLRNRFNLNIIALNRGGKIQINISPDYTLRFDDILVVIGEKKDIRRLSER